MADQNIIQVLNNSTLTLQLDEAYTGWTVVSGANIISQSPAPTLAPYGASTTMTMDPAILSQVKTGEVWMSLGYAMPSGYRFGVKILVPIQVAGIGDRPFYYVAHATDDSAPSWYIPGSDPSMPYDFHSSPSVKVMPMSTHTSLRLNVEVWF